MGGNARRHSRDGQCQSLGGGNKGGEAASGGFEGGYDEAARDEARSRKTGVKLKEMSKKLASDLKLDHTTLCSDHRIWIACCCRNCAWKCDAKILTIVRFAIYRFGLLYPFA